MNLVRDCISIIKTNIFLVNMTFKTQKWGEYFIHFAIIVSIVWHIYNLITQIIFQLTLSYIPMTPYLAGVTVSADLGCELDVEEICNKALNASYSDKHDAAVMTIRRPKTTALMFRSGKMVWAGNMSVERLRIAGRKLARIVQMLGYSARFTKFQVVNLVARYDVDFEIRLELLAISHFGQFCVYEPETCPYLVYKMQSLKILIFTSGKMIFNGAKKEKQVYDAFVNIMPIVEQFKRKVESSYDEFEMSIVDAESVSWFHHFSLHNIIFYLISKSRYQMLLIKYNP